jgi:uncharacterized protein (DUF362 family)/Pyruvate/2-oxoacid:ferredoxin oxidoreductase delta subunit
MDRQSSDVSLIRCPDYERDRILSAVKRAVDMVGGMGSFVKPGARVLIKPNLLKGKAPEAAVTTHPEIVRAVIMLVREAGGEPMVGDSPGMGDLRKVCEKAGILDVVNEERAVLVELDEAVQVRNQGRFQRFEIARAAYEADAIINLPKLKTHGMTILTGAVKNLFGCVPGKRKVQWHFNTGVNHDLFATMLNELCALLKPRLTIMDAVIGMEGNGPGSGEARPIGVILAGQDPVAVDVVSSRVLGISPEKLPLIRAAAAAGYGVTQLGRIRILGESIASVEITGFRLPPQEHLEWRLPEWVRLVLKDALTTRPVINNRSCIQCGICQGNCPQGAIENRGRGLEIRYRDCIRCFCCQEFCPQGAITVGRGWVLKIMK